uniref:Paraneoplastic antigen Ma-like C-terminal domain-containing protein n=1 Tax=Magallana gigas TaxID=29159 RepID=A0A8W8NZZ6_MAGGI
MSDEDDNVTKTQPTSPFESKPVDKAVYERMLHKFQSMGLNPKGNNPAELGQWMKDFKPKQKIFHQVLVKWNKQGSLTGSAARIVMYQGPDKPLSDILETLNSVYGSVENKQQLLSEFYRARQRGDEDITAWSGRLEEIIGRGLEKGIVRQNEVNSMLHSMLWTGLRQELKDISGYKYDNIQDFNKLRIALRQIEKDHQQDQQKTSKSNTATSICKSTNSTAENSDMEDLKGMVQQLVSSVQQQTLHSNTEEINITEEHNTEEHTMDNNRESKTRIKHQPTTTSINNSKEDQL